jgi:prepilin-type N-terminal cleavage/methylation domain-containing protein
MISLPSFPLRTASRRGCSDKRGFTIIEVLIAAFLLSFVSAAVISSLMFSSRCARLNTNAVMAKNIAQGYFERMRRDTIGNVNSAHYPNMSYDSTPPVWLDEGNDTRCKVTLVFKGAGTATAATANRLEDSAASPAWVSDEWKGHHVYIIEGPGVGQYFPILSNTATALNIDGNFSRLPVAVATKFRIDNGITVRVTTEWQYLGRSYSQTISSLVAEE